MSDDRHVSRRAVLGALGTSAATAGLGTTNATPQSDRGAGCPGTEPLASPDPGPAVLYEDPVTAPQFELEGAWSADPILVCGQTAYDDGEFLYQGWPYDDHGAEASVPSGADQALDGEGDLVYPAGEEYAHNAADILEIRVRETDRGVAYRVALSTLVERDVPILAIGVDTGSGDRTDWGHGLGDLGAPVDHVVTATGSGATLDDEPLPEDACSVDVQRNVLEVEVPLEPDGDTWRHYAVAGIHDGDGGFAQVQAQPDDENPGGAFSDEPPVFDVGFRTEADEPISDWRDASQAEALGDRDISGLGADVDFERLADGDTDRSVPRQGYFNRLYASRLDLGEGIDLGADNRQTDPGVDPTSLPDSVATDDPRTILLGDVQPYSVYIPESYDHDDPDPTPLVVMPHSLGQNYNQYAGAPKLLRQLGEERDAIIVMFEGRGPSGWWKQEAEYDLFEAWADLNARYEIDFDRVAINGYSMGGYGTYRLGSLYPDLFGSAFSVVGPADEDLDGAPTNGESERASRYSEDGQNTMRVTDNLRHVPLLIWAGTNDELVPYPGMRNYRRQLAEHGYRHRLDSFPGFDHFAFFVYDEWGPGAEFLGEAAVTREPDRVTYRAVPEFYDEAFDQVYDGAYWVQAIEVADGADDGLVDATSLADGYGEPVAEEFQDASTDPAVNTREGIRWQEPLSTRTPENAIELTLEGVASVTLYVDEADVDTTHPLEIRADTDRETEVTLESGAGTETVTVSPDDGTATVTLCERGRAR